MSAGSFSRGKYECDGGDICPVRIQPETAAATFATVPNTAPAGATTMDMYAKVNKSRREYGIGTRFVTCEWDGAPPAGYLATGQFSIAVLTQAVYNGITVLSAGVYLGANFTVLNKFPETMR